jgi:hypothetical protein
MTFYLQDVSGGLPLTDANTIAVVQVSTTALGCRGTIVANPSTPAIARASTAEAARRVAKAGLNEPLVSRFIINFLVRR